MRTHKQNANNLIALAAALALSAARPAFSETVPITTNLLVNLNGDSLDNFIYSGTSVQVWKDLAEDGSNASQQDFGQGVVTRQPGLLAGTAVPNSSSTSFNYNVLDFDRSRTVANNRNSGPDSDTLKGKFPLSLRPAAYGDAFTEGADSAYEAANTTGLSWFMVFRSSDQPLIMTNNNLPHGSGSGGTTSRWGQQAPFDVTYENTGTVETPTAGADWIGTYLYDKPDASDFQVNLSSHVRDTTNTEIHNDPAPVETSNLLENTWYMMANSYNPTIGSLRTVLTTPNGSGGVVTVMDVTKTDAALINANGLGNAGAHVATALGSFATSAGGNNDWAFDGLMAEFLTYSAPLNTTDLDLVATYLNDKYFVSSVGPGDYNLDGKVDAADYVVWRKDPASHNNAQGYTDWRSNFGAPGGSGSGSSRGLGTGPASVPEPTTLVLLAAAVACCSVGVRRNRD